MTISSTNDRMMILVEHALWLDILAQPTSQYNTIQISLPGFLGDSLIDIDQD